MNKLSENVKSALVAGHSRYIGTFALQYEYLNSFFLFVRS